MNYKAPKAANRAGNGKHLKLQIVQEGKHLKLQTVLEMLIAGELRPCE